MEDNTIRLKNNSLCLNIVTRQDTMWLTNALITKKKTDYFGTK